MLTAYAADFYWWLFRQASVVLHYEKQKFSHIFDVEFRQSCKAFGNVGVQRQSDAAKMKKKKYISKKKKNNNSQLQIGPLALNCFWSKSVLL